MKRALPLLCIAISLTIQAQRLYEMPENVESRVSSLENPNGFYLTGIMLLQLCGSSLILSLCRILKTSFSI